MNVIDLLLVPIGNQEAIVLTSLAFFITVACLLARTRAFNKYLFVDRVFCEHVEKRKQVRKSKHQKYVQHK